jgi:hypothetical protein
MSQTVSLRASINRLARASPLALIPAEGRDAAAWDDFVQQHPEGRFSHLWGYRSVLEQAYGYKCAYFKVLDESRMVGVFPSIVVRRGLGCLVSQPFNEYGGPLTQSLSAQQHSSLPQFLVRAAQEEGCQSIEIRGGVGCEPMAQTDYCFKHPLYFYGVLKLAAKEQLWRKSLTNEARKDVARAEKSGLVADVRRGISAVEGSFYDLYLRSMKRLGVPPHSRCFFTKLAEALGNRLVAVWVMSKVSLVATLLGAIAGQRLQVFITASDSRAWPMRPNDLAHWKFIEWAASAGMGIFDFGSARYAGQIQFKKKWGVSLREYSYYCLGPPGSLLTSKIQSVKTDSRSMIALSRAWGICVPVSLTRVLGPPIRSYLTK